MPYQSPGTERVMVCAGGCSYATGASSARQIASARHHQPCCPCRQSKEETPGYGGIFYGRKHSTFKKPGGEARKIKPNTEAASWDTHTHTHTHTHTPGGRPG
eukprot:1161979-Pelagomonas_calceolata.AAC.19